MNDQQCVAIIAGMLYASGNETTMIGAVLEARTLMDLIYRTEPPDEHSETATVPVSNTGK